MQGEHPERIALAGELRSALDEGRITLHYQPKVRLSDAVVCAAEALARWDHAERGMVPPALFVPIAEETGMIRQMTRVVLENAVRQQHEWLKAGRRVPVAVNLSARNLADPQLCEQIKGLLATWGVPGDLIEYEIVENALVEDPVHASKVIAQLKDLGGRVYIDDFGTGFSSLSYLVTLGVHALKIDRSFIVQMTQNAQAKSVVGSIISMAHGLGMSVVAEGVETKEDEAMLREMGCDEAQGYYYAKPAAADDIAAKLFS